MNRKPDPAPTPTILAVALLAVLPALAGAARAVQPNASVVAGRKLAIKHCARCHVIGDYNRLGGIGSTPSFQAMTTLDDYKERFKTFFQRRPHPVFVRVPGYPRWSNTLPYAPVFKITTKQINDILHFAESLERKARRDLKPSAKP